MVYANLITRPMKLKMTMTKCLIMDLQYHSLVSYLKQLLAIYTQFEILKSERSPSLVATVAATPPDALSWSFCCHSSRLDYVSTTRPLRKPLRKLLQQYFFMFWLLVPPLCYSSNADTTIACWFDVVFKTFFVIATIYHLLSLSILTGCWSHCDFSCCCFATICCWLIVGF